MNKILAFIFLALSFSFAHAGGKALSMADIAYLSAEDLPKLEEAAFEGSPREAYMLGRYYYHYLDDKKRAAVWYYIGACFHYRSAERSLAVTLAILSKNTDYDPEKLFRERYLDEIARSDNDDIFTEIVRYHRARFMFNNPNVGERLVGKISPRLLRPYGEIAKEFPRIVGFSQPIEEDELVHYKQSVFSGDIYSAPNLFAHYRYVDTNHLDIYYISRLWHYISALAGVKDAENIILARSEPVKKIFDVLVENQIEAETEVEKNFIMFKYHSFSDNPEEAKKYMNLLKDSGVHEKFFKELDYDKKAPSAFEKPSL